MRIAIDGTPAATQSAGVGRYTRELLRALVSDPNDHFQILTACETHQADQLDTNLPPGAWRVIRRLPVQERYATILWHRLRVPLRVDHLLDPFDVFHGPDFVLPPTRHPAVVTIHDMSFLVAPEFGEPALVRYLQRVVPRSIERASAVITVSASVAKEVVAAYPSAEGKIRAIPNGVTPPVRRVDGDVLRSSEPVILTVGTIEPRKNHDAILDAMPAVWSRFPEARLVLAGRIGWRSDEIVARIRDVCRSDRARFIEAPTDEELERLYRRASVFVYPSHYEGFGLPVLEAMARGVPVVASNIPALRETAGDAALFADPADPEELASAVVSLLESADLRQRITSAGASRVAVHSWSETARRTRLAYAAVAKGGTN